MHDVFLQCYRVKSRSIAAVSAAQLTNETYASAQALTPSADALFATIDPRSTHLEINYFMTSEESHIYFLLTASLC